MSYAHTKRRKLIAGLKRKFGEKNWLRNWLDHTKAFRKTKENKDVG